MSDVREQFKQDSLPIDDDLLTFDLDRATEIAHADSTFVRQLEGSSPQENGALPPPYGITTGVRAAVQMASQRSGAIGDHPI